MRQPLAQAIAEYCADQRELCTRPEEIRRLVESAAIESPVLSVGVVPFAAFRCCAMGGEIGVDFRFQVWNNVPAFSRIPGEIAKACFEIVPIAPCRFDVESTEINARSLITG